MIGFCLRSVILSIAMYVLLSCGWAISVVTLGGQIMGAVILGVACSLLATVCKHLSSKKIVVIVSTALCFFLFFSYLINHLPGYDIHNISLVTIMGVVFGLVAGGSIYSIENR